MGETAASSVKYSRKIQALASRPVHRGAYFPEDASSRGMALVTAKHKDIKLYFMVDPESNAVWDAKFFAYGGSLSVAIGETICSLAKENGVQKLRDLSPDAIERELRDSPGSPAANGISPQTFEIVNPLVETILAGYPEAKAVALASGRLQQQKEQLQRQGRESLVETDKQWLQKPKDEQIGIIDELFDEQIRPGLNMDGGDITIMDMEDDGAKLLVKWQGACGGCASSVGATLSYIEDTLRREVFSQLEIEAAE